MDSGEEVAPQALPAATGTAEMPAAARDYPARLGVVQPAEYNRLLPLVKWLLALPHFVAVSVLAFFGFFVVVYAFFAVLFTGAFPRGAFDYLVGLQRWAMRVTAYTLFMVDDYPPFTLGDDPGYPLRLVIDYPAEGVDNWRPLVHWILIWPYAVVTGALVFVAGLGAIASFFTILFTREYPRGLFEFTEVALRWQVRTNAYAHFGVTRYPPFTWG